jgi:hypothetical protein
MPHIHTYYTRHLGDILDRLNEEDFNEPVVQDYGDKGSVTFNPPLATAPAAPDATDPNDTSNTGRPDRVTGSRQNRQPA